jgi:hypothetical protein
MNIAPVKRRRQIVLRAMANEEQAIKGANLVGTGNERVELLLSAADLTCTAPRSPVVGCSRTRSNSFCVPPSAEARCQPLRHSREQEAFRRLIVAARNRAGAQQDVAKRLKRPQSFVAKYEGGERRLIREL